MPRGRPKTKPRVSDADILIRIVKNGGNLSKTAADLKVAEGRVLKLNLKYGGVAAVKRRETVFDAIQGAVLHLAGLLESMNKDDGETAKSMAIAMGVSVDKLLLIVGKPIHIQQQQTKTEAFDPTKISRSELLVLLKVHDKLNGISEPITVSDIDHPVVYDDTAPDGIAPPEEPGP